MYRCVREILNVLLLKWNTMTVNECLRIKKSFSWDYKWWLQHIHPTSWAFTQHQEHSPIILSTTGTLCKRSERQRVQTRRESGLVWKAYSHCIMMLYLNRKLWKRPCLLELAFKILFHSLTSSGLSWVLYHTPSQRIRSEIVCASPTGSTPSWDPSILCLRHGSKPLRNSAYKTGSNAHTECYFKNHPN